MLHSSAPYLQPFHQHEGGALGQEMQCSPSGGAVPHSPQPSVPASRHNGSMGSCPEAGKEAGHDGLVGAEMCCI